MTTKPIPTPPSARRHAEVQRQAQARADDPRSPSSSSPAIAWIAWYLLVARWHEDTDDAYVAGQCRQHHAADQGTVVSIDADDGMKVVAGQALVQLDPNDARVAFDQADANLANTVRQVRGLYSAVDATPGRPGRAPGRGRARTRRRRAPRGPGRQRCGLRRRTRPCPQRTGPAEAGAAPARTKTCRATARWSTRPRCNSSRRSKPPPRSCARPTSTCSAPRSSRRSPATSPSARCSSASACSPARR